MFCLQFCVIMCRCLYVIAVDQSFERMGFGVSQSHDSSGYTYVPQQMSTQSAVNVSQYSTADPTAAYPNSRYASTHHHQVALQVFLICVLVSQAVFLY